MAVIVFRLGSDMNNRMFGLLLVAATLQAQKSLPLSVLRDKIAGGWAGQMIGVSYGAPTEFRARGRILEGELNKWTPDRITNSLNQDDLYVDMTFAKVLDDKGELDVEKLRPFFFAPEANAYYGTGKRLGDAFSIGQAVRKKGK